MKKFFKFLKDNDVYHLYKKNANDEIQNKQYGCIIDAFDNVKDFLSNAGCVEFLIDCFVWRQTNQGQIFWENLHELWRKHNNEVNEF